MQLQPLIDQIAIAHGLNPLVVSAVITIESGGAANLVRFEPNYLYLVTPDFFAKKLGITLATETCLQRFSYGPMQLMGANFRTYGYGNMLTDLVVDSAASIDFSCEHLGRHYHGNDTHAWNSDAIAAYNAGSVRRNALGKYVNQEYVDKVRQVYLKLGGSA